MATFGFAGPGTGDDGALTDIKGGLFTCGGAGVVQSFTIELFEWAGGPQMNMKCALFKDSDKSFVGESVVKTWTPPGPNRRVQYTLNASGVFNVTAQDYILVGWADNWRATLGVSVDGATETIKDADAYGAWPDPLIPIQSTDNRKAVIFCTYALPAVGGPQGTVVPKMMMLLAAEVGN
jgi:hypothetical protein